MRELPQPPLIKSDNDATELVRYWLANDDFHISLLLGMWEDAETSDVDELFAWANVLADIARHIANGLQKSHNWPIEPTMQKLKKYIIEEMDNRSGNVEGDYLDD